MATRTVTTVFAVQGEKDYRTAIQNINREIGTLNEKLKLNATRYKGQEDSMEAIRDKADALNDLYSKQKEKVNQIEAAWKNCKDSAKKYEEQIQKTQTELEEAKTKMDSLKKAGGAPFEEAEKNYKKLTDTLSSQQAKLDAAVIGAENWEKALYGAQNNLIETERKLKPIASVLDEQLTPEFEDAGEAAEDAGEQSVVMKDKMSDAVDLAARAVAAAGLKEAFREVRDAIWDCVEASVQFEEDMTGVFKTVDLTAEEEAAMSDAIKELSTRIPKTTTEIAEVAEAAGQLGIAKDDILKFSEVMLMMGTATKVGSLEAAESLAKFSNITGVNAEEYEKLGSVIVDLGNKNATQEADIIALATRMAATGDVVGMSAVDIMAYATALSSVGIEAEAGGTAISKLFKKLETSVEEYKGGYVPLIKYAEMVGISSDEFAKLWDENSAGAVNAFIKGIGKLEEEGKSTVLVMDDLGLSEQRLSNAVLALASKSERLDKVFREANTAWEEGTALSKEAEKRYATTGSEIDILKNSVNNLKIAIGDDFTEVAEPVIEGLTKLANAGADLAEKEPGFSTALSAIAGGLGALTALATGATVIKGLASAVGLLGPHAAGIALAAGAIGAVAGAVATLVSNSQDVSAAVDEVLDANERIIEKTKDSQTAYDDNTEAAERNKAIVDELIEKLWLFHDEAEKTTADKAIIQGVVDDLNELLPGLGATYDGLTDKINMTRGAMELFAEAAANQKMLDALNAYMSEMTGEQVELEVQQKLTAYELEAAKERRDEAQKKIDEYLAGKSYLGKSLIAFDSEYMAMLDDLHEATKEIYELTEDQADLDEALEGVNREMETAKELYDEYAEKVTESKRVAEDAMENGKLIGEAYADGMAEGIMNRRDTIATAIAELGKIPGLSDLSFEGVGSPNYDEYERQIRVMTQRAAGAADFASGMTGMPKEANITIINELDGKVLSREISRVQLGDANVTARARGIR